MKKIPRRLVGIFGLLILAGCGSVYNPEPVGIGPDAAELKASPCACLQIETLPGLPEWFVS
ncbi:MAG: hypothetical protein GY804_12935 [Alphaproteobacteria bacterium]|nr:hypothetical protein [Alphaproteobacteria bacterium]